MESTADRPLRVLVAGGRRLVRDAMAALVERHDGLEVVGATADVLSTCAAIEQKHVEVVVAHVWLGTAGGGAELAVSLRSHRPEVGVVLLMGDGDVGEVREVLDQGTAQRALLLMDHPQCARDLPHAIREVADGGSVVHPGVVDLILRAERTAPPSHLDALSPRERAVLAAIANGATNKAVAELLALSDKAVEKHINQLYTKLGLPVDSRVHRRVAAALVAHGRLHGDAVPLSREG